MTRRESAGGREGQLVKTHSYNKNQSLATSAHEFNSPRTGFQRTFRQHFVHSDLLPPDAKDPSDVATAQAWAAAPSSAGAWAQARAALLPPGVEKLLHLSDRKRQGKMPMVSRLDLL